MSIKCVIVCGVPFLQSSILDLTILNAYRSRLQCSLCRRCGKNIYDLSTCKLTKCDYTLSQSPNLPTKWRVTLRVYGCCFTTVSGQGQGEPLTSSSAVAACLSTMIHKLVVAVGFYVHNLLNILLFLSNDFSFSSWSAAGLCSLPPPSAAMIFVHRFYLIIINIKFNTKSMPSFKKTHYNTASTCKE